MRRLDKHTSGMYKPVFCTGRASTASTKSPGSCRRAASWLLCMQVSRGMLSRYCSEEVTACLPDARLASKVRSGPGKAGKRLLASSRNRLSGSPAASLCQKSSHNVSASAGSFPGCLTKSLCEMQTSGTTPFKLFTLALPVYRFTAYGTVLSRARENFWTMHFLFARGGRRAKAGTTSILIAAFQFHHCRGAEQLSIIPGALHTCENATQCVEDCSQDWLRKGRRGEAEAAQNCRHEVLQPRLLHQALVVPQRPSRTVRQTC